MRIVYLGSPDFAVLPLAALHAAGYEIAAVVTQPDKPRSRGVTQPTPVKRKALELGLPVLEPVRIKAPESVAALRALAPDLLVVVAYGQILSKDILDIPRLGAVNIHASLLPAYRGAAPIHWAVLNGETETGVTIMYLDEGMDTGDIISSAAVPIGPEQTTGELYEQLCRLGADLLLQALPQIAAGAAPRLPQQAERATYAPLLKKEHEPVDWGRAAADIHNQIRGLNPWPGAYTTVNGKRLKLWQSSLLPDAVLPACTAGQVIACGAGGVQVACGTGALCLREVQPEGKGRMTAADYARGYQIKPGVRFGAAVKERE